jgi:hypothetical protein
MMNEPVFSDLVGKTFAEVSNVGNEIIRFVDLGGVTYELFHEQDCCENVYVEDICGDLSDLVGTPILAAEEAESLDHPEGYKPEYEPESFTWTFYKLATIKGSVTIRWLGESNGYYSESVDFRRVAEPLSRS